MFVDPVAKKKAGAPDLSQNHRSPMVAVRDYIHVDDFAWAYALMRRSPMGSKDWNWMSRLVIKRLRKEPA